MTTHSGALSRLTVLAVGAHPDDIEFAMAGTLLRLRDAGALVHMWNLSAGSGGTATLDQGAITRIRWDEAREAAALAGFSIYPPITDDFVIFYDRPLLTQVSARIREIQPDIILTHALEDYMEDHQNTARLVVSGAFARASINFITDPPKPPWDGDTAIYHAMPHGLRNNMRRRVPVEAYVDIAPRLDDKCAMLACHRSQKEWLDQTQGMNAYLNDMIKFAKLVGDRSKHFTVAEGWRRHSGLGFGQETSNPLANALGSAYQVEPNYEKWLNQ